MATNSRTREFEFNAIYVIDSLGPGDLQTAQHLYDDVIRRRLLRLDFMTSAHFHVETLAAFVAAMHEILQAVRRGKHFPFIHLEIHGNPTGLVFASGEMLQWRDLTSILREMNSMIKNNLTLSLATCCGAYIMRGISPVLPAPFFAYIGAWVEVAEGDIVENFHAFFDHMLSAEAGGRVNLGEGLFCLNGCRQRPWTYDLFHAEQVFDRVMKSYEDTLLDEPGFSQRVEFLVKATMANPAWTQSEEVAHQAIRHGLIANQPTYREQFRRQFLFLTDLPKPPMGD
jgi:hypothetical protein